MKVKVITPNCRVQFTAQDIEFIKEVLDPKASLDPNRGSEWITDLLTDEQCRDLLLDDPHLLEALRDAHSCLRVSPHFYFYVVVRHALRQAGIEAREVADYIAELLSEFSSSDLFTMAMGPTRTPGDYFVDMLQSLQKADDRTRFLIRTHMGNQSLFMTGVFPERIKLRSETRGFPDLSYYESLGQSSFREASHHRLVEKYRLSCIFEFLGEHFQEARRVLNDMTDRVFMMDDHHGTGLKWGLRG